MHQLDKMRSIRQTMQHQTGIHFAPPPPPDNLSTTIDYPPFRPPSSSESGADYRRPLPEVRPSSHSLSQLKQFPSSGARGFVSEKTAEESLPQVQTDPEVSAASSSGIAAIPASKTIYDSSCDEGGEDDEDEEEEQEESDEDEEEEEQDDIESSVVEMDTSLTVPPVVSTAPAAAEVPAVTNLHRRRIVPPTLPSVPTTAAALSVPAETLSSAANAVEAAAAALYAKKLEQLLAEKEQEILNLKTSQLRALEAQLLQPPPQAPLSAPSVPPVEAKAPSPQQQHIHIHNHFPSGLVEPSSNTVKSETKPVSESSCSSSSVEDSKENKARLNSSNAVSALPGDEGFKYPYEMPYYAPRPQKTTATAASPSRQTQDVEVVFGTTRTSDRGTNSQVGTNSSTNKGSTLVERALDLSGLTLERLRELTGRY